MATQVNANQLTDYWQDAATQTLPDFSELISTGFAQDGNPVAGQKATLPGAAWFNIMAAVRVSVILAAGKEPSNPPDPLQFLKALQSLGWMESKSIKTDLLADKSVTTAKLDDKAVTIAKIANELLASQSQAETGTANDVLVTPLRVKQAIAQALKQDLPKASATQLGGVKVTGDDGITINSSGEIAVDFSQMPTDKFEDLVRSIRVPIWQTKTSTYYVDGTNGSDELTDGRGSSEKNAFKTITACLKYITENINLGPYNANVRIKAGTYTETLEVSEYNTTMGSIYLMPLNDGDHVIIENRPTSTSVFRSTGGEWNLQNMTLHMTRTAENADAGSSFQAVVSGTQYSTVNIYNCSVLLDIEYSSTQYIALVTANTYANVYLRGNLVLACSNPEGTRSKNVFALYAGSKGNITLQSTKSPTQYGMTLEGDFNCVAFATGGYITMGTTSNYLPFSITVPPGKSVTGQRYACVSGGNINTGGEGPEYFPGTTEGSVNTSTYSWYQ